MGYQVTINIANAGTPTSDGGKSSVGHMWYTLTDSNGVSTSYGFAPSAHGSALGPGSIYTNDNETYLETTYSATVDISESQYNDMKNFGENPSAFGFDLDYNGLWNSCIDFTWSALGFAGLTPDGYDGELWPPQNIEEVRNSLNVVDESGTWVDGVTSGAETLWQAVNEGAHSINTSDTAIAINTYAPPLIDSLTLVEAIKNGEPLPIVASELNLANTLNSTVVVDPVTGEVNRIPNDTSLAGAASVGNALTSLASLDAALESGNGGAIFAAGVETISNTASAYAAITGESIASASSTLGGVVDFANDFLPFTGIINSIVNKDPVGLVVNVVAYFVPVVGQIYAIANLVKSVFTDNTPPEAWGNAHAEWSGYTTVTNAGGGDGGQETVQATYDNMLAFLDTLATTQEEANPSFPVGIVANRLPSLSFRDYTGYQLTDIDPLTGAQSNPDTFYDRQGNPYKGQISDTSSQSLFERFIYNALERGAIAPQWEVETAALQTQAGDPVAGLTEEERAARTGKLAAQLDPNATEQTFRPVGLDLNGDGVQTTGAAKTVAFNVDDSGYYKSTQWLDNNDGFLFLDRNLNGVIDGGMELFSNSVVTLSQRGLNGMRWVDSNYDGKLTALDPVFDQLKVWQDANGDGQQNFTDLNGNGIADPGEPNEVLSLADLGITELNYAMGTFIRNGVVSQMASPDLIADVQGSITYSVPEGIVVEMSNGEVSLVVTQVDDLSAIAANMDSVSTYEDTEAIIGGADLLANDSLGGNTGAAQLSITGVSNFTHGSGFLDANGNVHFMPDANYFGPASFDYTLQAATGQTTTARVELNIQNVNDAPTVQVVGGSNSGSLLVSDPDTPNGPFTFAVTSQSRMGQGNVDASGNYSYTNWTSPNTPGTAPDGSIGGFIPTYSTAADPFTVTVTDPDGASASVRINAEHSGAYTSDLGSGGKKPIAIDMGGDGFAFTDVNDSNVFFDVNSDGFKHRTAWPSATDGLLAYDINGNGLVDDGSEISFVRFDAGAQTDLQGLRSFDSNGDGIFSAQDTKWSQFGVWMDTNQDGITDAGEFQSLDALGISAIGLTSDGQFQVINGQTVHGLGTVSMADGTVRDLADVTLAYSDTVQVNNPDGTTATATKQPFATSGQVITGTAGKDLLLGNNGNTVIYALDGADVVFSSIGNDFIDGGAGNDAIFAAEGADVVEAGAGDDVVFGGAGNDLIFGSDGHDALFGEAGNDIVFGGAGNDMISGDSGNDLLTGDAGHDQIFGGSGNDAAFGGDGNDQLLGMDGHDLLYGDAGDDTLDGGAGVDEMIGGTGNDTYSVDDVGDIVTELAGEGNDTVEASIDYTLGDNVENLTLTGSEAINGSGNAADNTLKGNEAANVLRGGAGNDMLIGGAGNDTLIGGAGNDYYLFNPGDGSDVIVDAQGNDTLYIGGNLSVADVEGDRIGNDMVIRVRGTSEAITLRNWFIQDQGVNRIKFAGGTSLDGTAGIESLLNRPPVANDDAMVAFEDGGIVITPAADLLANDTDPNPGDLLMVESVGVSAIGAALSLVGGEIRYDIGNRFQELREGAVVYDSFEYTINDGKGATATAIVHVTIVGTNDVPVANVDTNAVQEDVVLNVTGNVLANDSDIDQGDVLSVANAGTFVGTYGTLTLNADGSYSYALDNASMGVQSLAEGQVVSESFDYVATDGMANTPSTLTVSITGTNDAPVVVADTNAVQEDVVLNVTGNVLANDSDIDQGDVLSVTNAGTFVGTYGKLTLNADGSYSYALDNASMGVQSLAEGQVVSDSFDYVAADGMANTPSTLTVSITGTNDAPIANIALDDQVLYEGVPFTYQMPVNAFIDIDQGDVLSYSATLANGDALPAWLHFDPNTQTFSSDLPDGAGGLWDVTVTATDLVGASARSSFQLDIANLILGTPEEDDLVGTEVRDVIYGFGDDDRLTAGASDDVLIGGTGNDVQHGEAGNDILIAEIPNVIDLSGAPLIAEPVGESDEEESSDDRKGKGEHHGKDDEEEFGNNLLDGGAGRDTLIGGGGNDLLIGGAGDDLIRTGGGSDIIAFNAGDGRDLLRFAAGEDHTLSLGGGIVLSDLALSHIGNDLVLEIGASESIRLSDWYAQGSQTVSSLQMISQTLRNAEGRDHRRDKEDSKDHSDASLNYRVSVQTIDFGDLVEQFDESGEVDHWSLMHAKLDKHFEKGDEEAMGGDLAAQFALRGGMAGLSLLDMHEVLSESSFGEKKEKVQLLSGPG